MTHLYPKLPTTLIIGVGNKARQGKDQFTSYLVDILRHRGVDARRYAFAEGLYTLARVEKGMTTKDPRLLQDLGMEYRRRDLDIWVKACLWRIADDQPQVAVISDTRFWNEASIVKSYGGLTVRVQRTINGQPHIDPSRPADHPSEVQNDPWPWDVTIQNSGDLNYLRTMTYQFVRDQDIHGLNRTQLPVPAEQVAAVS